MLPNPRHWPWWGWALCVVATLLIMVLSAALIYRQTGMRELRAEVARLKAEGYGVFPADLVALAPDVDQNRQEHAWRLLGNNAVIWDYPKVPIEGMMAHYKPSNVHQRDQETQRVLTASESLRAEWRTQTNDGPVVTTILGWIRVDLPHPETAKISKMSSCRVSNLLAGRSLAQAFAAEARTSADPRAALQGLDSLVAAHDYHGTMIDAMVLIALARIRDDAWLEATLRDYDPQPWIAHLPDVISRTTESLASERMSLGGAYAQNTLAGKNEFSGIDPGMFIGFSSTSNWWERAQDWLSYKAIWFSAPHDATFYLQSVTTGEILGKTGNGDANAIMKQMIEKRRILPISSICVPNFVDALKTAVQTDGDARRMRLAAALVLDYRTNKKISASLNDLPSDYSVPISARAWLPSLRYLPINETHFRLDYDPATPPTVLIPAGTLASPTKPFKGGYFSDRWSLELDLAELEKIP